jgi:HJR/Mrr/RecB family endonuclease
MSRKHERETIQAMMSEEIDPADLAALEQLVQAGLVEVIPIADGEPFYRLSARFVAAAVLPGDKLGLTIRTQEALVFSTEATDYRIMARRRGARKRRLNAASQRFYRRANILILKLVVGLGLMWLGIETLAAVVRPESEPRVVFATVLVVGVMASAAVAWYLRQRKLAEQKYREQSRLKHLQTLSWSELELHVAGFYRRQGYGITMTPRSGDQGVDVIADGNGRRIAIQVKQYTGNVDNTPVQEVVGGLAVYGCTHGVVITTNRFTSGAKALAVANGIELIDGETYAKLLSRLLGTESDAAMNEVTLSQAG